MVEGFKITASKIKRVLKLAVHLPNDYYHNNKKYPLLLVFEGGLFFSFLTEDNKIIDMKKILDNCDNEFITIGLFSPRIPEWNISELDPYYSGNDEKVDISYSSIYYDYIVNDLIPLLSQKYRFNDDIGVMGINIGAISVIPLLAKYDTFKKGIIISPAFDITNDLIIDDINKIKNKKIYMYLGGKDAPLESLNTFYKIENIILENNDNTNIIFENENDNSIETIKKHIQKGLDFIV